MTAEEKDRITRAENIQRYTENRCNKLEEEKNELLGIIQQKDELIEKMKCCGNCKYYPALEEPCKKCLEHSKWELKK